MRSFQRLAPLFLAGFTGLTIASISLLASAPLFAQQTASQIEIIPTNQQSRRVALIIGNSRYANITPLQNPTNDARDMAAALRDLQFDRVIEVVDADLQGMESAVDAFYQEIQKGGTGVFYYAGHGIQSNGENYLIPVDVPNLSAESDLRYKTLPLSLVFDCFQQANNDVGIVILDASLNNPFSRTDQSFAMVTPEKMFIAYPTSLGGVVADGEGRNGTFTGALLKYIRTPGLSIDSLFRDVRREVYQVTNGHQIPWTSSSLLENFVFAP